MRRFLLGTLVGLVSAGLVTAQRQPPPTFRSGIDVVRLDVTVLDVGRHPILGLTQSEFTILVDGAPQPIVAFEPVVIPPAERATTEWMREVAPDVRSNALGEPRLIVILMDDANTPTDPFMVNTAKKIASNIIDELSPSDLAAVVFTMDNSHAQDFTSDHRLLRAAVDHFNFGMRGNPLAGRYSQRALGDAVKFLRERSHGRNAIMLISSGASGSIQVTANAYETSLAAAARALEDLRVAADVESIGGAARFSPVPIYGFNIAGLVAPNAGASIPLTGHGMPLMERPYTDVEAQLANESFRTLADMTGGRAIVNDNDPARFVPAVLDEMSAYYTIAYRATYPVTDGKQHRLKVRVDRDGAIVLPSDRLLTSERSAAVSRREAPPPLVRAIADLVPTSELPMAVTAAPFALPPSGARKGPATGVLTTLRVRRTAPADRSSDEIQVLAKVFTPEGKQVSSIRQNASLKLRPSDNDAQLDVLTAIPLEPGRYNLRVSAHSVGLDKTGSVYSDVAVPNFARDRVSLSGVLLSSDAAPIAAPKDAFARVVPVVPTSERVFTSAARVTAFFRVYQGGKKMAPVDVTIRLVDAQGREAAAKTEQFTAARFSGGAGVDVTYDLPLTTLTPGSYLLSIAAMVDAKTTAQRDVRFSAR